MDAEASRHGPVIERGDAQEDGEAIVRQGIADLSAIPEGKPSRHRLVDHLQLERGGIPVENPERLDPGLTMGGSRFLANGPG